MMLLTTTTMFIPGVLSSTGIKNRDDCLSGDFVLLCAFETNSHYSGNIGGAVSIPSSVNPDRQP